MPGQTTCLNHTHLINAITRVHLYCCVFLLFFLPFFRHAPENQLSTVGCLRTAMVYTGRADSQVHGTVKKFAGGGRLVGELLYFQLYHSTRLLLARYLTVYSTKLFTLVELNMLFRTRLFTPPLTRLI